MRIAHLSDIHWSAERLDDKIHSAAQIITALDRILPDIIVVAGDAFDHAVRLEEPAARHAMQFFADLRQRAPVLAIKGNFSHDRNSIEALVSLGILVSTEPELIFMRSRGPTIQLERRDLRTLLDLNGLEPAAAVFCTLPYPSSSFLAQVSRLNPGDMKRTISEALTGIVQGFRAVNGNLGPKILVFHGTVPGASISETQHTMGLDIELRQSDIDGAGFDLALCGHLHFAQQIGRNIFYPGGICYTHFGDEGRKGFWLHFNGPEWHSEYIQVEAVPMRSIELDFESPFFETPEWADTEVCDVQIRLALKEKDRERLQRYDWKTIFPLARSIEVVPKVATVESVRAESVRAAKTLPEKVLAWGRETNTVIARSVIDKATVLEERDADALIVWSKSQGNGK